MVDRLRELLDLIKSQCAGHADEFSQRVWQLADKAQLELSALPAGTPAVEGKWRDNDPRQKGRLVDVVGVQNDKVSYRNCGTGRLAVSRLARFKQAFSPFVLPASPVSPLPAGKE